MLFLGLIVFYLYYYDTCAYSISNSSLEIAFHSCTSYLLTLQPTRLAGYPRIQCSTIVVPWDIKLFNCTRNEAWNSSLTYFTWVCVFFFFVYSYFDLHLMSEQETDIAKMWFRKYVSLSYSAMKLVTLTAGLQRSIVITFEFLLASCQIQIQMQNSVIGEH